MAPRGKSKAQSESEKDNVIQSESTIGLSLEQGEDQNTPQSTKNDFSSVEQKTKDSAPHGAEESPSEEKEKEKDTIVVQHAVPVYKKVKGEYIEIGTTTLMSRTNKDGETYEQKYFENIINEGITENEDEIRRFGKKPVKKMSNKEVESTITELTRRYRTDPPTIAHAVALLLSKGAANRTAPLNMEVVITDKQGNTVKITKGEIISAMKYATSKDNFKDLARTLSESVIKWSGNLYSRLGIQINGDLAQGIDKRLRAQGNPPLTVHEAIAAASYATHLPNINALAHSQRMEALLLEDEAVRFGEKRRAAARRSEKPYISKNRKLKEKLANQRKQMEPEISTGPKKNRKTGK